MQEVTLDPISKNVKRILHQINKDNMFVAEHQTGSFGQVRPKKHNKPIYVPESLSDEQRLVRKVRALKKMLDTADPGINAGMSYTSNEKNDDSDDYFIAQEHSDSFMPEKVNMETGLSSAKKLKAKTIMKRYYEYVGGDTSFTDESNPNDDVFYVPDDIDMESSDISGNAKKKEKKKKKMQEEGFGKLDERISDQGKARSSQQYNTGAIENTSIGGSYNQ